MKIPVQKLVVRNGQQHTQTYWEEDDKNAEQPSLLATLGVPGLKQQKAGATFPVDPALQKQWDESGRGVFTEEDAEAAIAAGLTPNAAASIQSTLPEWTSLADHIYENNMDELPRPKGGWQNKDGYISEDQRRRWESSEVPLETAVEWIDAGFANPWSGIPELIRDGVPLERAVEWEKDFQEETGRFDGARLRMASLELKSGLSLEEAFEYRRAFHGDTKTRLGRREIAFRDAGFTPKAAANWHKVVDEYMGMDRVVALRDAGWTPSTLKSAIKEMTGIGGKYAPRVDEVAASQLIRGAEALGSAKIANEWLKVAKKSRYNESDDYFPDHVVRDIKDAEAYKARFQKETGVKMDAGHNYSLSSLLPRQRDALIDLFTDSDRSNAASQDDHMEKSMELAKTVGSSQNLEILRDHGFTFGNPETKEPYRISYASDSYGTFDAENADEHSRNKWMKEVAFRVYSKKVRQQSGRDRWTEDDRVDPVRLKNALMDDPNIDDVRLDALLVADITAPVADGWL